MQENKTGRMKEQREKNTLNWDRTGINSNAIKNNTYPQPATLVAANILPFIGQKSPYSGTLCFKCDLNFSC